MVRNPTIFPPNIVLGAMPQIEVTVNWGQNTPWRDPKHRLKEDLDHRKVFQISICKGDRERIVPIVKEMKKKGYDKDEWGEYAYLFIRPNKEATIEQKRDWEKRIVFSGTVNSDLGIADFVGLEYPNTEVDMEKLVDNNDGTGTYSATTAGKISVSQLLSKMKGPDGDRFWQCTAQNWHGVWTGFFLG